MSKVCDIRQGPEESPAAYLEQLLEAFHQCTSYNLEAEESAQMVMFTYINHAAPNIKKKLQSLERLGEKNLRDLVAVLEKMYIIRERHWNRER